MTIKIFRVIFILAVIAAIQVPRVFSQTPDGTQGLSEKELFDKGVALLKEERYKEATQTFSHLIQISPRAADAYKNRGVAYMKQSLYDLAVRDFLKTIEIKPDLKGLYSNLGVAFYYQKEYRKAIEYYDREILQSPDSYFTYFNRAICWAKLDENEKSLGDIDKTLEIMPDLYPALCLKGDLYSRMNQLDMAKQVYQKAISTEPEQTYAKNKMAELKLGPIKEPKAAPPDSVPAPQKTIPSDPENAMAESSPTASGEFKTYELQVGAFKILENARKMQQKLEASGYPSRVMTVPKKGGRDWHLVRTAAYPSYTRAKAAAKEFEKNTGMDVMVKLSTRP